MKKRIIAIIAGLAVIAVAVVLTVVLINSKPVVRSYDEVTGTLHYAGVSADSGGYIIMPVGDGLEMSPDKSFGSAIEWSSSAPEVATVDNGLVVARGIGRAVISMEGNKRSGTYCVMVDSFPREIGPAGSLQLQFEGSRYGANVCADDWASLGMEPSLIEDTEGTSVFLADGKYYVRSSLLFNAVCCSYGETTVIDGGEDVLPQLSGSCNIVSSELPVEISEQDEQTTLYTYSRRYQMPDGRTVTRELYTVVSVNASPVQTVMYDCLLIDGIVYEAADRYTADFGMDCELNYSESDSILTLSFKKN